MQNEWDQEWYAEHPVHLDALNNLITELEKREKIDVPSFASKLIEREEEIGGVKIDASTGNYTSAEMESADKNILRVVKFFKSSDALWDMVKGENPNVEETDDTLTVVSQQNETRFGPDGTLRTKDFICPECGRKVKQLLKNGYCSKSCAAKARAAKA